MQWAISNMQYAMGNKQYAIGKGQVVNPQLAFHTLT
jgi:hypothetical protein